MAIKLPNIWPFRRRSASIAETTPARPALHPLTSEAYETSHSIPIDLTEASKRSSKAKGPKNLSMAWDDDYLSLPGSRVRDGGMLTERDRKDTYYKAYIGNPWVRACIEAIAKRFTSGKWELEEVEQGKGSQENHDKLCNLLLFVNDDEDFKQFLRSIAVDLGIFGEAFAEVVYANGEPAQLHKIDCVTMSTQFDKHGQVIGYTQTLDRSTESVAFEPDQVIRWWLPDPRASKKALSPIECMKDSVYLYQSMVTWGEKFFKQGGRPNFSIEMGEDSNLDDANRYLKFFRENYMGINNAHMPPVFYGGSKLVEFGHGSIELDFLKSLAWCRDEILSGFNVPLDVLGIQETAHLGGGSGESANKIFVYNTVKPIEQLVLEKLNYRLVQRAFGIDDWLISVSHADYRDDQEIAKVSDTQIRNGSLTINEARQERGRPPVKGGDEAVIVASRDILPVERNAEIAEEQRQQAKLSLAGAQAALQQSDQDDQGEQGDSSGQSGNSEQGTEARGSPGLQERAKPPSHHWQDHDQQIQQELANLREKGVKSLTWHDHLRACEKCHDNDGVTVKLGERFPSGAYIVPEHDHCKCGCTNNLDEPLEGSP